MSFQTNSTKAFFDFKHIGKKHFEGIIEFNRIKQISLDEDNKAGKNSIHSPTTNVPLGISPEPAYVDNSKTAIWKCLQIVLLQISPGVHSGDYSKNSLRITSGNWRFMQGIPSEILPQGMRSMFARSCSTMVRRFSHMCLGNHPSTIGGVKIL